MNPRLLRLTAVMLAGAPLVLAAQQPTRPMAMQHASPSSCPAGMHDMMLGMGGGMMGGAAMGGGMMGGGAMGGQGQRSGAMGGQMHGQMGGMMSDSSAMLHMKAELGLSDAQVQQFRSIHERACTAAQPHMKLAMQARQAAMQALQGDSSSLDAYRKQLDQAAAHLVEAQVEMAKGMLEIRKSLTPAQRQKLDQMHQQMMQGGMRR